MSDRTGWMEKRNQERIDASVKVSYHLIPKEEIVQTMANPSYRESTTDHLPELSKKSVTLHAVTRDLSVGGMSIVGAEPFPENSAVEIQLHLPGYPAPLTLLAEIVRADIASSGSQGTTYRAGVKLLAINRRDVTHLDKFLLAEKIRQRNAGK
jgi:c-di-GMP-binding flagellar brake protein YcgR